MEVSRLRTDVLVVGGGGAGARAAIAAARQGASVALASRGPVGRSGITPLAQWSLEAALGYEDPNDSPDQHYRDIIREGRSLSDQNLARVLADDAPQRVLDLESYSVRFAKRDGKFRQMSTPGQTYPRSVQIEGGGHGMMMGLRREVKRQDRIRLLEDVYVVRLFTADGAVTGALALDMAAGRFIVIQAPSVILATGGYEELWPVTDCPPESMGDGFYLAYHAGATLCDLELLLYYPVVACHPRFIRGTIIPYEATLEPRYCHGKLLNVDGEEFLPPGKLPARDIMVTRIFEELEKGKGTEHGGVFLDLTASPKPADEVEKYLLGFIPEVTRHFRSLGVDLVRRAIEVAPAAHYTLGGIRIDADGRTDVPGLYAAGECAGNVQGANRSSGNALAETQVFGARAGSDAATHARAAGDGSEPREEEVKEAVSWFTSMRSGNGHGGEKERREPIRPFEVKRRIHRIMGDHVGYGRTEAGLQEALAELARIREDALPRLSAPPGDVYNLEWMEGIEAHAMVDVAEMVVRSALLRKESRGHHIRRDYPRVDNQNWLKHTTVSKGDAGMRMGTAPVVRRDVEIPVE